MGMQPLTWGGPNIIMAGIWNNYHLCFGGSEGLYRASEFRG